MKRLLLVLAILVMVPGLAMASDDLWSVKDYTFMDGTTAIAASANYSLTVASKAKNAGSQYVGTDQGFMSFQVKVTGSGTMKLEVFTSIDGVTFVPAATDGSDALVAEGLTAATGFDSDGKTAGTRGNFYFQFACPYANKVRIVATETAGANTVTPTILWMKR